jgi:hypothetical protein
MSFLLSMVIGNITSHYNFKNNMSFLLSMVTGDIPSHYHGAKAHLQPRQEFFYLLGQEEEGQVSVVPQNLLLSLLGASTCCKKARLVEAVHKT